MPEGILQMSSWKHNASNGGYLWRVGAIISFKVLKKTPYRLKRKCHIWLCLFFHLLLRHWWGEPPPPPKNHFCSRLKWLQMRTTGGQLTVTFSRFLVLGCDLAWSSSASRQPGWAPVGPWWEPTGVRERAADYKHNQTHAHRARITLAHRTGGLNAAARIHQSTRTHTHICARARTRMHSLHFSTQ